MKNTILLVGSLQSGKTSTAAAIMGYYLTSKGIIPNFSMRDDGTSFIEYDTQNNIGFEFDIDTRNSNELDWFSKCVWPYVKNASFATAFKNTLIKLFGVHPDSVFGSNDQKNKKTHIKTANVAKLIPSFYIDEKYSHFVKRIQKDPDDLLSGRELMQLFGSEICRTIHPNCHIVSAVDELREIDPEIGIIPDGRFDNEIDELELCEDLNLIKIKLLRSEIKGNHEAEMAAPGIPDERYDLIVDNNEMSIHEKNDVVISYLIDRKVLSKGAIGPEER